MDAQPQQQHAPATNATNANGGGAAAATATTTTSSSARSVGGVSTASSNSASSSASVRIGRYKIGKTLGHGSFGKVKLARHTISNQNVAIKIINRAKIKSPEMTEKVKREIQILMMLNHPHIIRLYEVIETPTEIFLVLEYVAGGELFDYIVTRGKLHEEEARRLFQQVLSALAFCHHNGVVHRDLKPENLLLSSDGSLKVADFGLANTTVDGEFLRTSCGSPNYAAPEVISGYLYAGPEVDVWSAGVILYALLCGSLPFDDDVIFKLFKKIKAGSYTMPSHVSEDARNLIAEMLCVDPLKRITVNEIRRHPWFKYRLPPYLSISPAARKAAQKRLESEIDHETFEEFLALEAMAPLRRHREVVAKWILHGIAVPPNATPEQRLRYEKTSRALKVTYNLLLDMRMNKINVAQQRGVAEMASAKPKPKATFTPPSSPMLGPTSVSSTSTATGSTRSGGIVPPLHGVSHGDGAQGGEQTTGGEESQGAADPQQSQQQPPGGTAPPVASVPPKRSWYLGIQSKKDPAHVMAEVFRALRAIRCQWHVVSPYRLFCRWKPACCGLNDHPQADVWLYAGLQVYKIQSKVYLLDFQRIGSYTPLFSWMNFCTLIINALKPPSRSDAGAAAGGPPPLPVCPRAIHWGVRAVERSRLLLTLIIFLREVNVASR